MNNINGVLSKTSLEQLSMLLVDAYMEDMGNLYSGVSVTPYEIAMGEGSFVTLLLSEPEYDPEQQGYIRGQQQARLFLDFEEGIFTATTTQDTDIVKKVCDTFKTWRTLENYVASLPTAATKTYTSRGRLIGGAEALRYDLDSEGRRKAYGTWQSA